MLQKTPKSGGDGKGGRAVLWITIIIAVIAVLYLTRR